jgi:hypothetical protein
MPSEVDDPQPVGQARRQQRQRRKHGPAGLDVRPPAALDVAEMLGDLGNLEHRVGIVVPAEVAPGHVQRADRLVLDVDRGIQVGEARRQPLGAAPSGAQERGHGGSSHAHRYTHRRLPTAPRGAWRARPGAGDVAFKRPGGALPAIRI